MNKPPLPSAQKTLFQTTDADLAAYLCARAYPLIDVDGLSPTPRFSFPPDAERSATAYYHDAAISAKSLLQAVRHIHQFTANRGSQPLHA